MKWFSTYNTACSCGLVQSPLQALGRGWAIHSAITPAGALFAGPTPLIVGMIFGVRYIPALEGFVDFFQLIFESFYANSDFYFGWFGVLSAPFAAEKVDQQTRWFDAGGWWLAGDGDFGTA